MADTKESLRAALADRYTIERELGAGGMATVYLAHDVKHDRKVAMKVLRPELAAVLGPDRFLQEIKIAAQLHHPHILQLYDSGEAGGYLYYVMPYVEGESLRERLAKEGELPIAECVRIVRDVVDALAEAHSHGVVHRDVKPDNVMLKGRHALVADFGIAKAVSESTGRQQLTTVGVALGTPAYMSPEQATAESNIDHRADIYAVGALAYELLTGRPPFTGETQQEVLAAHVTHSPDPVTGHREAVSPGLAQLVMRCLEKKPADRWQTALEMLPHLEALATPSGGMTPTQAQTASVPGRRRIRTPLVLGLASAAVVIVTLASVLLRDRFPVGDDSAIPRVAVIPFENRGMAEDEYFADGIAEEIGNKLSAASGLRVINWTSSRQYAGSAKTTEQIGSELAADYLVTGSVRWAETPGGSREIGVSAQLVATSDGTQPWAQSYSAKWANIFELQANVAQQVANALSANLSVEEREQITMASTDNPEAYQFYLQGREYWLRSGYRKQNFEAAQRLYERAIALDPEFALARAALSRVHGYMIWFYYDRSEERYAAQREQADAAFRLQPDLPQAVVAIGYLHYVNLEFGDALRYFEQALERQPNNAQIITVAGFTQRDLGNWEEVYAAKEHAMRLNPRDADLEWDMAGLTYEFNRSYAEALEAYDRASTLAPDEQRPALAKGQLFFRWKGQLDSLSKALSEIRRDIEVGTGGSWLENSMVLALLERDPDRVSLLLQQAQAPLFDRPESLFPTSLYSAWAHLLRGDEQRAHAAFDSARTLLEPLIAEHPRDDRVWGALGFAYAGLGRTVEAAGLADRYVSRWRIAGENYFRVEKEEVGAKILAQAGLADDALVLIEQLLSGPSWLSVHTLRLDPIWDPIRDDPRFDALLERYGN